MRLRNVFPRANVAKMCAIQPDLLEQKPEARESDGAGPRAAAVRIRFDSASLSRAE